MTDNEILIWYEGLERVTCNTDEPEKAIITYVRDLMQRERDAVLDLASKWRDKAKYIAIGNSVGAGCLVQAADELEATLKGKP